MGLRLRDRWDRTGRRTTDGIHNLNKTPRPQRYWGTGPVPTSKTACSIRKNRKPRVWTSQRLLLVESGYAFALFPLQLIYENEANQIRDEVNLNNRCNQLMSGQAKDRCRGSNSHPANGERKSLPGCSQNSRWASETRLGSAPSITKNASSVEFPSSYSKSIGSTFRTLRPRE